MLLLFQDIRFLYLTAASSSRCSVWISCWDACIKNAHVHQQVLGIIPKLTENDIWIRWLSCYLRLD